MVVGSCSGPPVTRHTFPTIREWPTWLLLVGCYGAWLTLLVGHDVLGPFWIPPAVLLVTLHSSLQHEMLHGHPTPSRWLNELLVFPALGLFVPYRRFRDLHIAHHRDEHLTDPYDDPESWYVAEERWHRAGPLLRRLLALNATLLGRVLLGPALSLAGFWRSDWRMLSGVTGVTGVSRRKVAIAWLLHAAALVPVLTVFAWADIDPLLYIVAVAYPAMSVLMIRTYIEHRAAEAVAERTAVVEAGPVMSLLFLNNNLHAVHHRAPSLPWFALPAEWRAQRRTVLDDNGGYHFPDGYTGVAKRWLLARREPLVHPFRRRVDEH